MKRAPIIFLLFFLSGISALIYEIVWTRMLTLVFGHTVFSVSVVLSAFMAGLGYGSYLWGHTIDKTPNPLLVYGKIEIGIAILCVLFSPVFAEFAPVYAWLHIWIPEHPLLLGWIKGVLAFLLMFLPTTLMGATLPIISKYYVTDESRVGSQVGILYAVNTLGAAVGCALTGYLLISVLGVLQTAFLAAAINLFVGIGAIRIFQELEPEAQIDWALPHPVWPKTLWREQDKLWVSISFVCGFTALAYEVLWTRLLVFSIASTVYSFSMMLTVFLLGIVLGSLLVVPVLKVCFNLRTVLIILQAGVGVYIITSLFNVEEILSGPWNSYSLEEPWTAFWKYFKDSAGLMLMPTLLLGMCFPLLTRIVAQTPSHVGGGTGKVYAFNTLGAILGSLAAGFLLLPFLGSQQSFVLVASINLLCAAFLFVTGDYLTSPLRKVLGTVTIFLVVGFYFSVPGDLLNRFFMRDSAGQRDIKKLLYFNEGLTDTVAIFRDNYGILDPEAKRLVTNGISMSASNKIATRYMKLFSHVPILLADDPKDVLVICFGTGQTVGAAGIHQKVNRVDAIDLSPGVVESGKIFARENNDALNNSKIHITFQDGRNYLLTTQRKYDVITAEPPPPRTAFTVNLYTKEYYELTQRALKPDGIVAQWIPLHSQSEEEVYLHFKTFRKVFPHAMAWMSVANEILIIGSSRPILLDFQKLKERIEESGLQRALANIEIHNIFSLLSCIWLFEEQIDKLAAGRPVITDNHPSIEFYLDFPDVIQREGLEKIVFNRASFEEIIKRTQNLSYKNQKQLKTYYRAMALYQRGVIYNNSNLLLEAARTTDDNNLFRYHLQGERSQIARLKKKIETDPSDIESLLNLGHAYFQIGDYSESLRYLNRAKNQAPNETLADLYIAYNQMKLGRRSEAKTLFQNIGKQNPRFLANLFQDIALIELLDKLETQPEDEGLMLAVAEFYNRRQDYLESLKFSLKVLERDRMNQKALRSIIISSRGLGEPNETLAYGIQLETVQPDDLQLKYIMAEMYVKTLRCQKAIPYLRDILKQDDTYPNAEKLLNECQTALFISQNTT